MQRQMKEDRVEQIDEECSIESYCNVSAHRVILSLLFLCPARGEDSWIRLHQTSFPGGECWIPWSFSRRLGWLWEDEPGGRETVSMNGKYTVGHKSHEGLTSHFISVQFVLVLPEYLDREGLPSLSKSCLSRFQSCCQHKFEKKQEITYHLLMSSTVKVEFHRSHSSQIGSLGRGYFILTSLLRS